MTTVYVVTDGEYSDYHICGVYDNREAAQAYIDKHDGGIEEYALNPNGPDYAEKLIWYWCIMQRTGDTDLDDVSPDIDQSDENKPEWLIIEDSSWMKRTPKAMFRMRAKDRAHAVKIANERRAMLIATEQWPA